MPSTRTAVAPIRPHPVALVHCNERRGNHDALVAELDELAVETVAAGARLIAKARLQPVLAQPLDQLHDLFRPVRKHANMAHLAAAPALGNGNRDGRLVHIQSYIRDRVSSPMLEARRRSSSATLDRSLPRGGPPDLTRRTSGLKGRRRSLTPSFSEKPEFSVRNAGSSSHRPICRPSLRRHVSAFTPWQGYHG